MTTSDPSGEAPPDRIDPGETVGAVSDALESAGARADPADRAERRLHPLTLIFSFARSLREFIIPSAIALFGIGQESLTWVGIGAAVLLVILAVAAIARYLRYTYRYEADELVVKSGVFFRNERHIPYARIQNIDAVQNVLHRALDLVVVHVQTGSGAEPEATLRVLPITALDEMRARVGTAPARQGTREATASARVSGDRAGGSEVGTSAVGTHESSGRAPEIDAASAGARARGRGEGELGGTSIAAQTAAHGDKESARPLDGLFAEEAEHATRTIGDRTAGPVESETLLHLDTRELLVGGFIDNRAMVVILGALALLERADILDRLASRWPLPDEAGLSELAADWFSTGMRGAMIAIVAVLVLLLVVRLLATAWTAVRLHDYQLARTGENLRSEYGLLTRVTATVPLRRIQVIVVTEGLLHRLLGRVQVSVVTAGGIGGQQGTPKRERVAPVLRRERLPELLRSLQPGLDLGGVEWQPVHPRAFGRMVRAAVIGPIVISGLAWMLIGWWTIALFVVLLARLVIDRALRARHLGWSLTGDSVVMRGGGLRRTVRVARFNRIQVVALDQNPFDRRARMADLTAVTAGAAGTVAVPYMPQEVAADLHARVSTLVAASEFTW